jgi:cytochrome o ubiquinol oxidase subunit 2
LLRCLVFCAAGLAVASCRQAGVLDPQGPIAAAEWLLLVNATEIMLVVVVPVILATLGFAWWYRSSNVRASRDPEWAYQGSIEFVVWSIPALVVILLGGVCWIGAHQLDPRAPIPSDAKALQVDVVSLDWKWLFIYPDQGIAAVNQLVVPAGTPVSFHLTSATVMNSFFIPQLGSQIYTMTGMTTHLNLLADKPGAYPGLSANFSGDGFAEMRFIAAVVPAGEFDGWVAKVRGEGSALDDSGYAALTKPSSAVPPATYRSVDPTLFERIVDQTALNPEKARAGNAWCPPTPKAGG